MCGKPLLGCFFGKSAWSFKFGNRLGTRPCPFRESFLHILDNMGVKIKRKLQNNSDVSCYFIIFTYHSWDRIQVSVLRRLFWLGSFLFLVRNSEAWGLQKECLGVYSQKNIREGVYSGPERNSYLSWDQNCFNFSISFCPKAPLPRCFFPKSWKRNFNKNHESHNWSWMVTLSSVFVDVLQNQFLSTKCTPITRLLVWRCHQLSSTLENAPRCML